MIKMKTTTTTKISLSQERSGCEGRCLCWTLWDSLAWKGTRAVPGLEMSLRSQPWSSQLLLHEVAHSLGTGAVPKFCCLWVEKDGLCPCWTLLRAQRCFWLFLVPLAFVSEQRRIHGCVSEAPALFSSANRKASWGIVVATTPLLHEHPCLGPSPPVVCGFGGAVRDCGSCRAPAPPAQPCLVSVLGHCQLGDGWVLIRPFLFLFALYSIFLLNGDCTLLKKAIKCKFHFLLQLMLLLEVALHICEYSLKEEEENQ